MFKSKLLFCALFALISTVYCGSCNNPQVTSKSFTTEDATIVTSIAYVAEFEVKCDSGVVPNLYADIDGNITPVSVVSPNGFQVSWTEDIKTAKSGERIIRIFDEDGYTALRKAMRVGEDISTVPSLFNVSVNHPGAFNGPWLKSEFLAAALSVIIAYLAISSRSKLLS